jgi:ubiquitin carboxyl-terminal hydrolase 10
MTTSKIGATPHGPVMTPPANPVHSSSCPTDAFPTAVVAAAPQDITSTATLSHPLEGSEQQDSDIVAPSAEPGASQILSTASTHAHAHAPTPTLAPIPTSLPKSYDASAAPVSDSSYFAPSSIGSSTPASCSTGKATLPRLRARGLVNTGNVCFANAVLHLLVNLPPFRNLFRELGDLIEQRGARVRETGSSATPLVDATVRFIKEFIVQEESPSTQQQSQPAAGGTSRPEEEREDDNVLDSFEPTYMYDAIKEKRQLKPLLVRSRSHIAASY